MPSKSRFHRAARAKIRGKPSRIGDFHQNPNYSISAWTMLFVFKARIRVCTRDDVMNPYFPCIFRWRLSVGRNHHFHLRQFISFNKLFSSFSIIHLYFPLMNRTNPIEPLHSELMDVYTDAQAPPQIFGKLNLQYIQFTYLSLSIGAPYYVFVFLLDKHVAMFGNICPVVNIACTFKLQRFTGNRHLDRRNTTHQVRNFSTNFWPDLTNSLENRWQCILVDLTICSDSYSILMVCNAVAPGIRLIRNR